MILIRESTYRTTAHYMHTKILFGNVVCCQDPFPGEPHATRKEALST